MFIFTFLKKWIVKIGWWRFFAKNCSSQFSKLTLAQPKTKLILTVDPIPEFLTLSYISTPESQIHLWQKFGPFIYFYFCRVQDFVASPELIEFAVNQCESTSLFFKKNEVDGFQLQFTTVTAPSLQAKLEKQLSRTNLNITKFQKLLNEHNAHISGSVIWKCFSTDAELSEKIVPTQRGRRSKKVEWQPNDLDIYLSYDTPNLIISENLEDQSIPRNLHKFLEKSDYSISYSLHSGNYARNLIFANLLVSVVTYECRGYNSPNIQFIILAPGITPEFFISQTFDIPQLKKFWRGNQFFSIDEPPNSGYLSKWFDIARFQLKTNIESRFFEYVNRTQRKIDNEIKQKRQRMRKYEDRGISGLVEQFDALVAGI